ncbi:MFS transporter [Bdellovibrio sp. HCB337]|uniref:MFS transporter n=1 Tax=Bdellovibrio sp. HCB337 TaxID=3394358 RepID=UPI0039A7508B
MAELGINCVEIFFRLHLLVFYTNVVGLNPALAGLALGLAIFWDALLDPIIGSWSDRTRQKLGHRSHWILVGIVAVCLALWFLLNPPPLVSDLGKFLYLLLGALFFNTAYTLLSVPYSAIVGDITSTERERARLIGWRLAFANVGGIAGIAIPAYFLIQESTHAYQHTAVTIGILVAFSGLIAWFYVRQQPRKFSLVTKGGALKMALKIPFQDKRFMPLAIAFFVGNIGLTFNTSLALYYYRLRLRFSEVDLQTVLLLFLFFFTLSIPLWLWLSKKYPKQKVLIAGATLMSIATGITYPLLPAEDLMHALFWASFCGGTLVGTSVLLESLLTDIVKKKEEESLKELMGTYFGFWKMIGKISRGLALGMTGQLLEWAGVHGRSVAAEGEYWRLALAFGPIVSIFFLASAMILYWNERKLA